MKRRMMMIATFMLAIYNTVLAEDKVTISDFSISAGETKEVSITLANDVAYVAFQFDLYLPDGITVESFSADRNRLPESTTLSMAKQSDGSYRFISAAIGGEPISGTSGGVVTLSVKAATTLTHGSKTGYFRHVKLSKADATGPTYDEMSYAVTVIEPSVVTVTSCSREYGEANPTFEYTVTGGALVGTPEITCEAIITSPVGTYSIKAQKGSITNFNVSFVDGTLTVNKAPLKITAKSYTIKQGEALPTFEATYEGFKNSETKDVLTKQPTITTSATSASEPNTYDIVVSGAEAQNYDISYVNGTLTITEADPVTITAKSYSREYGEANPTFEFTSEGAALTGTPEITCEATATSPVGTYPIIIKKGTVTNYNDTYVNGTLTITKAPLTVKVEDATREQYLENPEFVISYTGWKVGDDESVLIKKPTATTEATKDSPVGEYTIVVSGGEAKNYELKYQNGVLTIIESTGIAEISVTSPADVYTLQGHKVRTRATTLDGLPKGVYVVNGKKVIVK